MITSSFLSADMKEYIDSLPETFNISNFNDSDRYNVTLLFRRLENNMRLEGSGYRGMAEYYGVVFTEVIELRDSIRNHLVKDYDTVLGKTKLSDLYRELDFIDINSFHGVISFLTELLGILHFVITETDEGYQEIYTALLYVVVVALSYLAEDNEYEAIRRLDIKWARNN